MREFCFTVQTADSQRGLKINPDKCKAMCVSTLRDYKERSGALPSFSIDSTVISYVKGGVYRFADLGTPWGPHGDPTGTPWGPHGDPMGSPWGDFGSAQGALFWLI